MYLLSRAIMITCFGYIAYVYLVRDADVHMCACLCVAVSVYMSVSESVCVRACVRVCVCVCVCV